MAVTRPVATIRAELTAARAHVFELEAELALAAPERCRLALLPPSDGDPHTRSTFAADGNPEASW